MQPESCGLERLAITRSPHGRRRCNLLRFPRFAHNLQFVPSFFAIQIEAIEGFCIAHIQDTTEKFLKRKWTTQLAQPTASPFRENWCSAMSLWKFRMNKDEYLKKILLISNVFLAFAGLLTIFYLIVFLVGGDKSYIRAILAYASWMGLALIAKLYARRALKGLRIGIYEYLIGWLCVTLNYLVWFRYPIAIILSISSIVCFFFVYRAQHRRP